MYHGALKRKRIRQQRGKAKAAENKWKSSTQQLNDACLEQQLREIRFLGCVKIKAWEELWGVFGRLRYISKIGLDYSLSLTHTSFQIDLWFGRRARELEQWVSVPFWSLFIWSHLGWFVFVTLWGQNVTRRLL